MCLAVPAKVVSRDGDQAAVDLQGNRLTISSVLTPEARAGDWVLVHAGFAISTIDEADALETWDYLRQADEGDWLEEFEGRAASEPTDQAGQEEDSAAGELRRPGHGAVERTEPAEKGAAS